MKFNLAKKIKFGLLVVSTLLTVSLYQSVAIADESSDQKIEIPKTSTEILQVVDKQLGELNKTIDAGQLGEVHHHAFAIRDLVDALPEHSAQLSADKLEQVKSNVKYVDTLAKRLDESGDAKDKKSVMENLTKLKKLLDNIHSNYSTVNALTTK